MGRARLGREWDVKEWDVNGTEHGVPQSALPHARNETKVQSYSPQRRKKRFGYERGLIHSVLGILGAHGIIFWRESDFF